MEFDLTINNSTSWSDPKYDFYQVTHTGDVKVRLDLFCTAEELLFSKPPVVLVYWYTQGYVVQPSAKN